MAQVLTGPDYAVFGVTLGVSALIGIFYAIKDRKSRDDVEDYLLGGRNLSMVPVALSLSVSFMSAITVLGTPADVYVYGTMYWWFLLAMLMVSIVVSEIFIPTFYRLGISSTYEYLDRRFNRPVRLLGTIVYVLENIFYIGIVIYAPALALNAVTGFDLWLAVLSTGFVCIFYTALGGIKAVIWTDVFQAVVMLGGFLAITIKGSIDLGGYANVWKLCEDGGRIDFVHFEFDPRIRHTFWSVCVGGTFLWLSLYGTSQSQVQRYLCCKSERQAKGAVFLNWLGLVIIISLSCVNGTIMYAYFKDCDPITNKEVGATDQLLPYLSLKLFANHPGVTGLVISCVFSGSLSTVSSGINALSCVTIEDFVRPYTNWKEGTYSWWSKGAVVVYGGLCIGMAYVASQLGGVLEAALSILGLVGGPLLGLFSLGFMFPCANSVGAFVGLLAGLGMTIWVYVGKTFYPVGNEFIRRLDVSTAGCNSTVGVQTTTAAAVISMTSPPPAAAEEYPGIADLYAVSYVYYSCIGYGTTVVIGLLLSALSCGCGERQNIDPRLMFFPFDHWLLQWLPAGFRRAMRCGVPQVSDADDGKAEKLFAVNGVENSTFKPDDEPKQPSSRKTSSQRKPPVVTSSHGVDALVTSQHELSHIPPSGMRAVYRPNTSAAHTRM